MLPSAKYVVLFWVLVTGQLANASPAGLPARLAQIDTVTERWGVFELTISDSNIYTNPFWDVTIHASFTSPGGSVYKVNGFYYDGAYWKVRFSSPDTGLWQVAIDYTGQSGLTFFAAQFRVANASTGNHGFILTNPSLPHTFIQSDGTPFIPLGNNGHTPAVCAAFLGIQPSTEQVPAMWDTLATYNINTFRLMMFHQPQYMDSFSWNPQEGSANLLYNTPALDQYDIRSCLMMDRWFSQAQSHNIAFYLCMMAIFDVPGYPFTSSPWSSATGGPYASEDAMFDDGGGTPGFTLQQKYMQYVVSRWGAYRNLVAWEYNNEFGVRCNALWLAGMDSIISVNDPYGRAHTVSVWNYEFSDTSLIDGLPTLDLTDDHCYETDGYTEFNGDSATNGHANYRFYTYQKPVMFGEFGSGAGLYTASDYNYERLSYWGALLGGGYPLFWLSGDNNMSGWAFNLSTIQFLGAVNNVITQIPLFTDLQPGNGLVSVSEPDSARVFCLADSQTQLVYLHHFSSHSDSLSGLVVTVGFPYYVSFSYHATWINATTGQVIATSQGETNTNAVTLAAPAFMIDELLLLQIDNAVLGIQQTGLNALSVHVCPNPFTESTCFNFSIERAGNVSLKIFDTHGKLIDHPIEGNYPGGLHNYYWRPDKSLSGGLYYYMLQSSEGMVSGKVVCLK